MVLSAIMVTITRFSSAQTPHHGPDEPLGKARPGMHHKEPSKPQKFHRPACNRTIFPDEFRAVDGRGNNPVQGDWGSAETTFLRMAPNNYDDGASTPASENRPSARFISNEVMAQGESIPNSRGATDFLWQWGQFLDHDITQTPTIDPAEPFDIQVPTGDPWFDPESTGTRTIPLNRSYHETVNGIREQVNEITAFIDASNVYGSTVGRANALRTLDGTGRLKTTWSANGDLLPYNEGGLANAPNTSTEYFLAGDVRANEQVGLTVMHTLFVREHNHWAAIYQSSNPDASDERIYQYARAIVGGEMQRITYQEYLPVILGRPLPPYKGYQPRINPGIANEFAAAAYRFGHSLLSPVLLRLDAGGEEISSGNISLKDAFFSPYHVATDGIDPVLRGLAAQTCQELDSKVIDELRNFLFGPPGAGGLDLAALNIQRGRDHGLPGYNGMRRAFGAAPARDWRAINRDTVVAGQLATAYQTIDDIDLWVGALCETHVKDAMVGPMLHQILTSQFTRLRDGDRFWYESYLPGDMKKIVNDQTLAKIIRRNTSIGEELPDNVFVVTNSKHGKRSANK